MTKSVARLYKNFQPEHYGLALSIDKEAMTFSGKVMIRGKKVGRPSERLTFHQKGLKITSASAVKHDKKGDQPIEFSRINNQNSLDEVRLHSEATLYPGEYTVTMEFKGKITRPMNGIYPCFFEHDGQQKKLIATQFESHYAREAFPCIDEPEAKATFDLTLITDPDQTVLSNMPAIEERREGSLLVTTFETTPKMSAYLLAFVIGEIGYHESKTKNGTVVRSYATPDNVDATPYSAEVAARILEFFEDYFGVPYPLPKLDMVALPDFSVGAMENWGLITFREQTMLVKEESSSIETRQTVALVTAHELSHQWFGNLVTMKWWDDLWLNESFANMMEYRAVDALYPEWYIWEQFVSHEGVSAKRRDSLLDVQSVRTPVNHPDEISTIFDPSIVYAKGGTLLHMLMHHLGEEAFRKGLSAYFKKHQYSNTEADDLWACLSEASGQDVGSFMHDWLTRPGYPLVTIDWTPGSESFSVSQKRFLSDPEAVNTDDRPWQVPLASTVSLANSLLTGSEATMELAESADMSQPLIANHDGTSYFLPRYAQADHLQQISDAIAAGQVSTIDRLLLLDNYILLQRGGLVPTTDLLELMHGYTHETSENVWGTLAMGIAEARRLIEADKSEEKLDEFVRSLAEPLLPELGWDDKPDDSAQTLHLRGLMYSLAAGAKNQAVIDEALKRFKASDKPADLSASTRSVVYFAAARYGDDKDFEKLLNLHNTLTNADEREEVAGALTSVKHEERVATSIELLKSKHVRRQDLLHWYAWLLRNRYARSAAWKWLLDNWDWAEKEMAEDKNFSYFPRFAGSVFSRAEELKEFQKFFEPKKAMVAIARDVNLAEQEIKSRVAWRERNEASVKKYFSK